MKTFIISLLICIAFVLPISCKKQVDNDALPDKQIKENRIIQEEYSVFLDYKNSIKDKIKGDFVVLFFENGFKEDSIHVFSNGEKKFSDISTTDLSLGLAEDIELGKMSEINEISFRINNGRDIIIRDISYNSLKINYKKDSIVWVDFSNKFVAYK